MPHDLETVLAAVRETAAGPVAAAASGVDRNREFPEAGLKALAGVGAFGLVIPTSLGGSGGGLTSLAQACQELGAACASTGMVFLMHSVTAATLAAGGGARATKVLGSMAEGAALGTLAFSERGTGAHFYSPELRATRTNGALHLSGRKSFVTAGGHADAYLVLAQGDAEGTADAYLLDRDQRGVRFEDAWEGLGMAGNSSIALSLDDVELAEDARVGEAGKGLELVFTAVAPFFLVGLAAVNVGIATAASRAAIAHAAGRPYADGSTLAEVQHVQHLIADMDSKVRAARLVVEDAAHLGDAGDPSALVPIMEAKVVATESAVAVTELALEATGGQGYTPSLPIERHLRDARAGTVMAPTNAVLKSWIGKALAGLPVP